MDYISGEEYCKAQASNAYSKASDLEKQVKELVGKVGNLQIEVDLLKKKLKDIGKEKEETIYYEEDTWFHPFKD